MLIILLTTILLHVNGRYNLVLDYIYHLHPFVQLLFLLDVALIVLSFQFFCFLINRLRICRHLQFVACCLTLLIFLSSLWLHFIIFVFLLFLHVLYMYMVLSNINYGQGPCSPRFPFSRVLIQHLLLQMFYIAFVIVTFLWWLDEINHWTIESNIVIHTITGSVKSSPREWAESLIRKFISSSPLPRKILETAPLSLLKR